MLCSNEEQETMQISCRKLALGYEGDRLVENLDFCGNQGDYLCIVGENGSGKTTLMRTLLQLQLPAAGVIRLGKGLSRRDMGYLPQQTRIQKDFPASVREIVLSGCQNLSGIRPFYCRQEKELAQASLERLEIAHLAGRCYRELSGGQQQRVLLARALCAARKILFLDEPVTGLDPKAAEGLYDLVAQWNREDGMTVIMVTHDIPAAMTYASHILYMGTEWFWGSREEYEGFRLRSVLAYGKGGDR